LGTLTAHAVVLGEGTSTPGFATIGTAGQLLIDQGSGVNPAFEAMSGDATITSTGALTVGTGKVTYAKMQNTSAGSVLLGNPTGSAAAPSEITLGSGLSFSSTTLVGHTGTVTSVSWTGDGTMFTAIADTPVTTSGTLTPASLIAQAKNTLLAGPTTGSNAAPTFRALGNADMPASGAGSGTVTSVSWTGDGTIFTASADTAVTTSGTLTPASLIAQAKNTFLSGPSTGSNAVPTFRALGNADLTGVPMTTAGDTIYGGTAGIPTRLGVGSAGQVLTVNSGATATQWSTPTTGTVTSVSWTGDGTVFTASADTAVTTSGTLTPASLI